MVGKIEVKKVVLDILKPLEPSIVEFAKGLNGLSGSKRVDLLVMEIDRSTETLKATLEGADIDLKALTKEIEKMGGTIHSVDQVLTEKD